MGEAKPLTAFQQTYHWRNKNCGPWSHQWVKDNLPGLKVEDGQVSAEIKEISSVSGDCDLGQRKGKLLTIYDLDIEAKWVGTDSEGEEVLGRVHIPEFSHEVVDGLSDYNFIIELTSTSTPSADALLRTVRASLPEQLKAKFDTFRPTLLEAHGIFTEGSPAPSGSSTPARYAPAPPGEVRSSTPNQAAASGSAAPAKPKSLGNTKTVEVSAQLQVSADDLWSLLTDEARVPMWSRSAAKVELKPEGAYELFGGNVRGTIKEVDAPKKLVQTWQTRNGTWPADHFGTLTTKLDQGSDSTTLTLTLDGVPSGQEGDLERALNTFYIQGLKQMGLVLSSTTRTYSSSLARSPTSSTSSSAASTSGKSSTNSSPSTQKPKKRRLKAGRQKTGPGSSWLGSASTGQVLGAGAIVGLGAVFVGLVVHSVQSAGRGQ